MIDELYNFFANLFISNSGDFDFFNSFYSISRNDIEIEFYQYLAGLCSVISLIFIVVLCCLFVYKIVRLIGGLIR